MSCTCIIHSILKQKSRKTASCLVKVFTRMGDFHSISEDRLVSWSGLLPWIIPRKYDVSLRRLLVFVPMNIDYMCIGHSVYMYNCQIKIKNNTRLNTFKAHKLFLKYTPHRIYRHSIFSMLHKTLKSLGDLLQWSFHGFSRCFQSQRAPDVPDKLGPCRSPVTDFRRIFVQSFDFFFLTPSHY